MVSAAARTAVIARNAGGGSDDTESRKARPVGNPGCSIPEAFAACGTDGNHRSPHYNRGMDDASALRALEARLQALLPQEYQDSYKDVEPSPMGSAD